MGCGFAGGLVVAGAELGGEGAVGGEVVLGVLGGEVVEAGDGTGAGEGGEVRGLGLGGADKAVEEGAG